MATNMDQEVVLEESVVLEGSVVLEKSAAPEDDLPTSTSHDSSDSKTIEQRVAEIMETQTAPHSGGDSVTTMATKKGAPRKFTRIRGFVQNLNEQFIVTLYEMEQRHNAEREVLQSKLKTHQAQEAEHVILVKHASERIQKLETQAANHKVYMQKAGEKISTMDSRAKEMDAREGKVIELAKKAAIKIKQLESRDKKHMAHAKKSAENTKKLKQMLMDKHDEMEGVSERALTELEVMAQELNQANARVAALQSALDEATKQHLEELKCRKAESKKISALRNMIEQYDGGADSSWNELSQALSDDTPSVNLLNVYQNCTVESLEDFVEVCDRIHESIPEKTKACYNQVGFFKKIDYDYHFPVLALGPFDVTEGPLRDEWLTNANHNMVGVYYYGQDDEDAAYDMIPVDSFIPYEEGVEQNFHIIPGGIIEKREKGLSAVEKAYEAGIKKINMEARSAPVDRLHPQKVTAEAFESDSHTRVSVETASVDPESMLTKLKEKITGGLTPVGKIQLLAELEEFNDTEPIQDVQDNMSIGSKSAVQTMLTIDVNAPSTNDPETLSATETSTGSDSDENTMTSLEEQMNSFMADIATSKNKAKTKAAPRAVELRTTIDEPTTVDQETRDDISIESKPSYEKFKGSSLVKDRLKMFSGQPSPSAASGKPPSGAIIHSVGGTKSVMKMWQDKTAGNVTPKKGNTSNLMKAFSFNSTVDKKKKKSSKIPAVPKNIQAKMDAGEALTEHEKEIMEGIEKFRKNATPKAQEDKDVVISHMMSNVSAVTFDQSVTAE